MKKLSSWLMALTILMFCFAASACSSESSESTTHTTDAQSSAGSSSASSSDADSNSHVISFDDLSSFSLSSIKTYSVASNEFSASLQTPSIEFSVNTYSAKEYSFEFSLPELNLDIGDSLKAKDPDLKTDDRGAISLDATVLFDYDSADLSSDGKASLKKFIDEYVGVIYDENGKTTVKKITVEGHTDTDGDYDYNMDLSQRRADSVMNYCTELYPKLKDLMVAKGCSYDYPVTKSDGTVDKAASRRVCFIAE